jgi:hypothetical protein
MKTITKTTILDIEVLTIQDNYKSNSTFDEEITDTIIDSFNEQIYLGNQFKDKMGNILNSLEFAYPNDKEKIQKVLDLFLESSHKLLGEYMNKVLDLYVSVKSDTKHSHAVPEEISSLFEVINYIQNDQWMTDWIDQVSYLRNKTDNSPLDNDDNDFCYYVDVTGKIN